MSEYIMDPFVGRVKKSEVKRQLESLRASEPKSLLAYNAEEIAEYLIKEGTESTSEGSWIFYGDEIQELFGDFEDEDWESLYWAFNAREEIADLEYYEENGQPVYDIVFYLSYCQNLESWVLEEMAESEGVA